MIRASRWTAFAALVVLAGCDFHGDDIVIEPEFDESFSFEDGLQEWIPAGPEAGGPAVAWDVTRTDEQAFDGTQSARLSLESADGQGRVWLERRFEVAPDTAYSVEIVLALGTSDPDAGAWTVLAGATDAAPSAGATLAPRDSTGGAVDDGVTWQERRYVATATASEDGEIWVHVGVQAESPAQRTYYIDDVRVLFTRISAGP